MGFEIVVHYYPASDTGSGWDQTKPQTKKHILGKRDEDCSFTRLAKFCITQNARRDVYVFDFEVYQHTKKQIAVKAANDARGGIVIKGKRFALDELQQEECSSDVETGSSGEEDPEPEVKTSAPAPKPAADKAPPAAQSEYDFVEAAKGRRIIPAGSTVEHPLLTSHVSCDYPILPRQVFFQPSTPNAAQRYGLIPAKIYQVLGRFVNKQYWQSRMQSVNTVAVIQNENGNIVLVNELDLTLVPTNLPSDVLADQRYDPDKIVRQQNYESPEQAQQVRAPQSIGEDDMLILRPKG